MKPIKTKHTNKTYAEDQPQYRPLPVVALESEQGEVIACWKGNFRERLKFLFTGKMYVLICTFNKPLAPSFVTVNRKEVYSHTDNQIKSKLWVLLNKAWIGLKNLTA